MLPRACCAQEATATNYLITANSSLDKSTNVMLDDTEPSVAMPMASAVGFSVGIAEASARLLEAASVRAPSPNVRAQQQHAAARAAAALPSKLRGALARSRRPRVTPYQNYPPPPPALTG